MKQNRARAALHVSVRRAVHTEVGAAQIIFCIDRADWAIASLHFRLFFAHAHCTKRTVGELIFHEGRAAWTDALRHRLLIKWDFHENRLGVRQRAQAINAFLACPACKMRCAEMSEQFESTGLTCPSESAIGVLEWQVSQSFRSVQLH